MSEETAYLTTFKGLMCWYGHVVRSVGALAAQLPSEPSFDDHVSHLHTKIKHLIAALEQKHGSVKDGDKKDDLEIMLKHTKQIAKSVDLIASSSSGTRKSMSNRKTRGSRPMSASSSATTASSNAASNAAAAATVGGWYRR